MIRHSLLVLGLLAGTARGDERAGPDLDALVAKAQAEAPTIETVARGALLRARRSVSIGPTVGLWAAAFVDPGDVDGALTIGLGFEMFDVPVLPSMETLQQLIVERLKAKIKQRTADAFGGGQPEPVELEALVKQVYMDVRD